MGDKILWTIRNGDMDSLKTMEFDANVVLNGTPILVSAADYGQVEVIKYLIKKGADVNKAGENGITPLLAAIWEDHFQAVEELLKNGAKKNGKCPDGSSYLEAASTDKIKAILK